MLLLLLLAIVPRATGGQEYDLASYLRIAGTYGSVDHARIAGSHGSANRAAALREIREWPPAVIEAAVADLRGRSRQIREVPTTPGDIAFGSVEAAVLMHAEAGLISLAAPDLEQAATHLEASVTLLRWSRDVAVETRDWDRDRQRAFGPTPGVVEIRPRIDIRDFYVALASGALAMGSPSTAHPFAENVRQLAPFDAEVQLVFGCVAEGLGEDRVVRQRESEAAGLRDQATVALLDALAVDPSLLEARLHLGRLHLERGRYAQAERRLQEVVAGPADDRQRYLARLFLGRVAARRGDVDEAAGHYRGALEAWPDCQAARLALAHALERSSGPAAALPLVAATLAASGRAERAADPWWRYLFGPPGLAEATFSRLLTKALDR